MSATHSAPLGFFKNLALLHGGGSVISQPAPAEPGVGERALQTRPGGGRQLRTARRLGIPQGQTPSRDASLGHTTPSPALFLRWQKGSTAESVFAFHVETEAPKREAQLASNAGNVNAGIASRTLAEGAAP